MGKRPDQLNVSDEPLAPIEKPDPRSTEWYRFLTEIEELIATGGYTWAEPTLRDIYKTVETTERVTEGQRKAIGNIEAARGRSGSRRRYEGYWRRR